MSTYNKFHYVKCNFKFNSLQTKSQTKSVKIVFVRFKIWQLQKLRTISISCWFGKLCGFLLLLYPFCFNYCVLMNANQKYITILFNSRRSFVYNFEKNCICYLKLFLSACFLKVLYFHFRLSLSIVQFLILLNLFIYLKIWTYLLFIWIYYIGLSVKLTILKKFAFRQKLCVWRFGHSKVFS